MFVTAPCGGLDTDQRIRVGVEICGRVWAPNSYRCRIYVFPRDILAIRLPAVASVLWKGTQCARIVNRDCDTLVTDSAANNRVSDLDSGTVSVVASSPCSVTNETYTGSHYDVGSIPTVGVSIARQTTATLRPTLCLN